MHQLSQLLLSFVKVTNIRFSIVTVVEHVVCYSAGILEAKLFRVLSAHRFVYAESNSIAAP